MTNKTKKIIREEDKYNKALICASCNNMFLVSTPEDYDSHICTCTQPLCSERCERNHNGGHSIEEMRRLEGEWEDARKQE